MPSFMDNLRNWFSGNQRTTEGPEGQIRPDTWRESIFGRRGTWKHEPRFKPEQIQFMDLMRNLAQQGVQEGGPWGRRDIYEPQTMAGMDQILKAGLSGLTDTGPLAQSAARQFQEQLMPRIGEMFAEGGGPRSSGYQRQLSQAYAGSQERLQDLVHQRAMNLLPQALRPYRADTYNPLTLAQFGLQEEKGKPHWLKGHPSFFQQFMTTPEQRQQIGQMMGTMAMSAATGGASAPLSLMTGLPIGAL